MATEPGQREQPPPDQVAGEMLLADLEAALLPAAADGGERGQDEIAQKASSPNAALCLSLAQVNGTSGLGPIGAMGVALAMLAMLRGLAVTGGVITSGGIVLAGPFTMLATLPLKTLTELGFTIAFGVLLDTFIVRSLLVPALVFDAGARVWWPSALARRQQARPATEAGHAAERLPEAPPALRH